MWKKIPKAILFSLLITVLFTSCSYLPHYSKRQKEELLLTNLNKWETFKLEGIIEVNHKIFSFRKNLFLNKSGTKFRLDIVDSGILGLSPSPFITAYYDSSLVLRLPGNEEFTEISTSKLEKDLSSLHYLLNATELFQFKDDILEDNLLQLDNIEFQFSDHLQIIGIDQVGKSRSIVLKYDDDLSEVIFFENSKKVVDIIIDKISFSDINIRSLNQ